MNQLFSTVSKVFFRITLFSFLICFADLNAQVSSYVFSTSTGNALNSMAAGTTQLIAGANDDASSAVANITFNFVYGCTTYTQFSVNSNGLMRLGGTAVSTSFSNNLTNGSDDPKIAPYWDDISTGTVASGSKVHYKVIGSAPNRKLIVEWLARVPYSTTSAYNATFQVELSETSNVIRFIYGSGVAGSSYTIGLATSSSDFIRVDASTNTSATTGSSDAQTTNISSGRAYTFTPGGAMAYLSSTVTQASTATLTKCDINQPITCIQVVTSGGCTPVSLTQLKIVMAGTAPVSDVSLIHIYYTGTSSTFSATGAFDGAGTAPAAGTITINGSQALSSGTNYFWVAYDMNPAGTTSNVVDAQCLASPTTTLTVGGVAQTVTANNPAGTRTIVACPTSPGSVSSGLTLWLKAGSGLSTAGANVTGWNDQSTAALAVTVNGSPDFVNAASGYNYNPYVNFTLSSATGGDFLRIPSTNIRSFFWVAKLNNLSRRSTHLATYDGVTLSAPCALCPIHGGENGGAVAQYSESTYGSGNFQSAGVWRKNGDASSAYNTAHSGNFDIVTALGGSAVPTNVFMGGQNDNLPSFDGRTRDWVGPVAEIISYTGAITAAQANKIESYLAIKYGITLGGNGSTTLAYTSPTGSTIWNSNTGYHYDVTGIGKDMVTESLDQPKSHSINAPADLITLSNSSFAAPVSMTNDGDYLVAGHNNGSLAVPVLGNYTHAAPSTAIGFQLSRIWRTQKTGAPSGNLIIEFDMALVNGPSGYGTNTNTDIRLLLDNDVNFSNASAGEHTYSPNAGFAATGGKIYFTIPYADIQSGTGFFTLGSVNSNTAPLPIGLASFEASCEKDKVTVRWTTATEINNDYFTVDRGSDGTLYERVGIVQGSGNSSVIHSYQWEDDRFMEGITYYRLRQTDFDGTTRVFNAVAVDCSEEQSALEILYASSVNGAMQFSFISPAGGSYTIRMIDVMGHLVYSGTKQFGKGEQNGSIDTGTLAPGMYLLNIQSMAGQDVKKVMIAK